MKKEKGYHITDKQGRERDIVGNKQIRSDPINNLFLLLPEVVSLILEEVLALVVSFATQSPLYFVQHHHGQRTHEDLAGVLPTLQSGHQQGTLTGTGEKEPRKTWAKW